MKKSQIRKKIFKLRKKFYNKNYSINFRTILDVLRKKRIKGNILGGYYPFNNEIDVIKILEKFEKKNYVISLPKTKKNSQMDFLIWSTKSPLLINKYGIPEPIEKKITYPDILLVPLIAYDSKYNRLGYGGGFYDRYIKKIKKRKKIFTIGLACSFQKVQKIPIDKHDIKLDLIINEKNK